MPGILRGDSDSGVSVVVRTTEQEMTCLFGFGENEIGKASHSVPQFQPSVESLRFHIRFASAVASRDWFPPSKKS